LTGEFKEVTQRYSTVQKVSNWISFSVIEPADWLLVFNADAVHQWGMQDFEESALAVQQY